MAKSEPKLTAKHIDTIHYALDILSADNQGDTSYDSEGYAIEVETKNSRAVQKECVSARDRLIEIVNYREAKKNDKR